jgi:hypothetical protein
MVDVGNMVVRAPQARQMVARGEREARSPWNAFEKRSTGLKGRQKRARMSVAPPGLARFLSVIQGQRARCARTCPWLPSAAPAALRTLAPICRACGAQDPGYHPPRLRRFGTWLPSTAPAALRNLATIHRACGASEPGYHPPRLRRSGPWLPSTAPAALRNPVVL